MRLAQLFDSLHFNNQAVIYKQIDSERRIIKFSVEMNADWHLPVNRQTSCFKPPKQNSLVNRLEEARSNLSMDAYSLFDHCGTEVINIHKCLPLCALCFLCASARNLFSCEIRTPADPPVPSPAKAGRAC